MKTVLLAALLLAAAARPGRAQTLPVQDPLSRQILSRQIAKVNGGVTAVVRLGSGQPVELKISADPLSGLAPVAGLAPKPSSKTSKSKTAPKRAVRGAAEQLKAVASQNWRRS